MSEYKFLSMDLILSLKNRGITIVDEKNTYIEETVKIEKGATIFPYTFILGSTTIKSSSVIYPFSFIKDSFIGEGSLVKPFTHLEDIKLEGENSIGPYSRLRGGTVVKRGAHVGNFVEMKNTIFGELSKAMHLTYIGDAEVGMATNIGAGTITCNYDGIKKNKTKIGKGVFVGSGTELVAPIEVGDFSYIAAGSTITRNVPPYSLSIARERQENKLEWVKRRKSDVLEKVLKKIEEFLGKDT